MPNDAGPSLADDMKALAERVRVLEAAVAEIEEAERAQIEANELQSSMNGCVSRSLTIGLGLHLTIGVLALAAFLLAAFR